MSTRVNVWLDPAITRSSISARFWNMMLREMPELYALLDLFGVPEPAGNGLYNHHDGLQR